MMIPAAKDIQPQHRGQSDFFSWQLFRYMRKFPQKSEQRIWAATWNSATGIDPDRTMLYIGSERDGEWIHARLLRNLCLKGSDLQRCAYGPAHDTANWVDVTDQFWADYLCKGVCAVHGDFAHRWNESEDQRTCEHCGKQEFKQTRMVSKTEWVTEKALQL